MTAAELTWEQLVQLRQKLEAMAEDVRAQLDSASDATQPVQLDQQSVGRVSRIDAIQQQQMAIANRDQNLRLAEALENALARIADGSYGSCGGCGDPIAFARLMARPQASLCIECQEKSER